MSILFIKTAVFVYVILFKKKIIFIWLGDGLTVFKNIRFNPIKSVNTVFFQEFF